MFKPTGEIFQRCSAILLERSDYNRGGVTMDEYFLGDAGHRQMCHVKITRLRALLGQSDCSEKLLDTVVDCLNYGAMWVASLDGKLTESNVRSSLRLFASENAEFPASAVSQSVSEWRSLQASYGCIRKNEAKAKLVVAMKRVALYGDWLLTQLGKAAQ